MNERSNKAVNRAGGIRFLAAAVVLGVSGALAWSFAAAVNDGLEWKRTSDWATVRPDSEVQDPGRARKVPDFTLSDRFGNQVSLSQFAPADLLLVNIWSSGCPACKTEIPSLTELDRRLTSLGRVALITITIDEKWEQVAHYFPRGTDLRVLFDPEQKVTKGIFNTTKYPETFILDKERRIRARFDGERDWHSKEMMGYIASFK